MTEIQPISDELLKQDGLARNEGSGALLEMMRSVQAKAEQSERFWFRMACGFWIFAGVCFLLVVILGSVEAHSSGGSASVIAVTSETAKVPATDGQSAAAKVTAFGGHRDAQFRFHPVRSTFFVALMMLPMAILGGIFSVVWLALTRRQAGQATMQMTIAALTKEIRDLGQAKAGRG